MEFNHFGTASSICMVSFQVDKMIYGEILILNMSLGGVTRLWRGVAPVAVDVTASDALRVTSV